MASITDRWETKVDGRRVRTARYGTGFRYQARWREHTGGPPKTQLFDRKIDAQQFLDGIVGDLRRGVYIDPDAGRQTFLSFADEWAAARDWKGTTRDQWISVRKRLIPLLGAKPLDTIDTLTLETAQRELLTNGHGTFNKPYAKTTTTLTMAFAGMVMRSAHVNGRIGRDPAKGLKAPKVRDGENDGTVGAGQVPTRADAIAILEATPRAFRAAIALGLTGLRVGEVLGMSADRLNVDDRKVTIDRQLQRVGTELILTTTKTDKPRTIVVPGVVAVELRRHLRDHQADGLLFRGLRGTPMIRRDQFYASAWRPALVGAGLAEDRYKFHSLRHFCASMLLAEGAPLTAVAAHLGDTVETVSRVYVHWLRDETDVPADVLDRVLMAPRAEVESGAR
jgi:integrase